MAATTHRFVLLILLTSVTATGCGLVDRTYSRKEDGVTSTEKRILTVSKIKINSPTSIVMLQEFKHLGTIERDIVSLENCNVIDSDNWDCHGFKMIRGDLYYDDLKYAKNWRLSSF